MITPLRCWCIYHEQWWLCKSKWGGFYSSGICTKASYC